MSAWRRWLLFATLAAVAMAACQSSDPAASSPAPQRVQRVRVTIDGVDAFGAMASQAGSERTFSTGASGESTIPLDPSIAGDPWIVASFPSGRARAVQARPLELLEIDLHAFSNVDDPTYVFDAPGRSSTTASAAECAHCHGVISKGFERSAHLSSASNPTVHDLYAGTAYARTTADACASAGGVLREGRTPGADGLQTRCYVGDAALAKANPTCSSPPCDVGATAFAGCADCHAPGIDGALGGRDLLEARGPAYDSGVFCDVCHKVEAVRDLGAPGVAGRLRLLRPSDPGPGPGGRLPLTFGPFGDVGLVRMGSVQRTIFKNGVLCTGCHEQTMKVAPTPRAPDGVLDVDSTSTEWAKGPLAGMPCQSCHGQKLPDAANAVANSEHDDGAAPDPSTGWPRPPGSIHDHAFCGPRGARNLAALALSVDLATTVSAGTLEVTATVTNHGAGHALPSGEAMRAMFLLVDATCDNALLAPTGGDVVPDIGGDRGHKQQGEDWLHWPNAKEGDTLRVVEKTGVSRDYDGPGLFAKGKLAPADKGLTVEALIGLRTIVAVAPDGTVALDAPLPNGDVVYLGDARDTLPSPLRLAGLPGFAFARVLVGADGRRAVPHFLATDVAFDDRIPPGRAATTRHTFAATCSKPQVTARLVHRAYPLWLAEERAWPMRDRVLVEVTK